MTFPRRLTPSEKERATIVQQRMTPGSALGVGSRHVRPGSNPAAASRVTGQQPIIAAATFLGTALGPTGQGWGRLAGLEASPVTEIGDLSPYVSTDGDYLFLNAAGWYGLTGFASISATPGDDVVLGFVGDMFDPSRFSPPSPYETASGTFIGAARPASVGAGTAAVDFPLIYNNYAGYKISLDAQNYGSGSGSWADALIWVAKFAD